MTEALMPLLAEASASVARTGIFELLGDLSEDILAQARVENLAAGEVLFRQGETGNCAYVVLDGKLDVLVDIGYDQVKAAEVERNELIGEIAVFSHVPRTATIVAQGPVRLLRIDGAVILAMVGSRPRLGEAIIADLGRRLAAANQPLAFFTLAAQALRREDFDAEKLGAMATRAEELGPFARSFLELVQEIEAKHRLRQDMAMAAHIQQSVLPRPLPVGHGLPVELAAFIRPMREVGGDFYDHFMVDDNRIAIAIADVSGKGVPAALFMMKCHTMLRSVAAAGLPVEECLDRINRALEQDNDLCVFVTLFFATLDLASGRLTYCSGGHNPPWLLRADGGVERLAPTGPAVGITPESGYRAATVDLRDGDLLFLFTDGVTEAESSEPDWFGEERLEACLASLRRETPTDVVAGVVAAADRFAASQTDDITCLALRRVS